MVVITYSVSRCRAFTIVTLPCSHVAGGLFDICSCDLNSLHLFAVISTVRCLHVTVSCLKRGDLLEPFDPGSHNTARFGGAGCHHWAGDDYCSHLYVTLPRLRPLFSAPAALFTLIFPRFALPLHWCDLTDHLPVLVITTIVGVVDGIVTVAVTFEPFPLLFSLICSATRVRLRVTVR